MASQILTRSADFPRFLVFPATTQVYAWRVASEDNPDKPVSRHRNLEFAVLRADTLNKLYAKRTPLIGLCQYESPESNWGACDGIPCCQIATVHHREYELEYCPRHFAEVAQ